MPELAEMDAVGVPPAMFKTANLAEEEAVLPSRRSSVILKGERAPADLCQKLRVPPAEIQLGADPAPLLCRM